MTSAHDKSWPADFHVLDQRIRLVGILTTVTGLHVGAGDGEDEASDLPVLRDAEGFPFIPGSSLKGVVRSTVEGLLRALRPGAPKPLGKQLWSCDPLVDRPVDEQGSCGHHATNDRDAAICAIPESCASCCLFGSRVLASHVRFSDAMYVSSERDAPPIEVRDGVAIDRDLLVVHGKQKYDFEVVAPGVRFLVEIFVENPKDWLMGLLVLGLDQLGDGFTALGGFGSRGLGRVRLAWEGDGGATPEELGITRVTARGLFEGHRPEPLPVGPTFDRWRKALAAKYQEER